MKNSLWIIIALVTGIVGFLIGYSVSSYTGAKQAAAIAGHGAQPAAHEKAPMAAGTGAPAQKPEAGGYGGAEQPRQPGASAAPSGKPEAGDKAKPSAAGY
jgi:hypothetical protein